MSNSIYSPIIRFFIACTLGVGCGDSKEEICSGHGEMHGTHCHCESGFVLSDDGSVCQSPNRIAQILQVTSFLNPQIFKRRRVPAMALKFGCCRVWMKMFK